MTCGLQRSLKSFAEAFGTLTKMNKGVGSGISYGLAPSGLGPGTDIGRPLTGAVPPGPQSPQRGLGNPGPRR